MPAAPGLNKYDIAKQQATERANAQAQERDDAIKRKFASLGTFNSGAALKQQQIAADEANRAKEQSIAAIDAAQADDESNRSFQREMQDRGFQFQAGESAMARKLQQEMQDKGFQFQGGQSAMERALREKALAQEASQFDRQHAQRDYQIGKEYGSPDGSVKGFREQEMEISKANNEINKILALEPVMGEDWVRQQLGAMGVPMPPKPTYDSGKGFLGALVNPIGALAGFF